MLQSKKPRPLWRGFVVQFFFEFLNAYYAQAEEVSNRTDLLVKQLVENTDEWLKEVNQRFEYFQTAANALTSQLETQLSQFDASRKEASQIDEKKRLEIEKALAELKNARKLFDKVAVVTTHPPTTAAFEQPVTATYGQFLTTAPVIPKTVVDPTPMTTAIPWGMENPFTTKATLGFDTPAFGVSPSNGSSMSVASNIYGTTFKTCEKCSSIFSVHNESPLAALTNPTFGYVKVATCPKCGHDNKL